MLSYNMMMTTVVVITMIVAGNAADINDVFSPCSDAKVGKSDGFTFGLAFSSKESFFLIKFNFHLVILVFPSQPKWHNLLFFRPKVDEISLLTINSSTFDSGGYMVAFAGRKYAARSLPVMVADNSMIVTSFTLVLEFKEGILQNLYWKSFGCGSCSKDFDCLNGKDCAVKSSKCTSNGGLIDCNLGVQLAFSGTDKNLDTLNSWYEVSNLRQYSLYGLYSDLRDSIGQFTGQF